jgi:YegS/Rv2252/BmrU family lipid kinase
VTSGVFVVINAKSGNADPQRVRDALEAPGVDDGCREWHGDLEVHEPADGEDIDVVVRQAVARGFDTVVAVGGDGTVSAVANALAGTPTRLGIIPLGTTNVLARELGIPLDLAGACALLRGPGETATIDGMRVGNKSYFTQIGIGMDALMIRDTPTEHKRKLGILAYLWTWTTRHLGFKAHRFTISADGQRARPRARQVLLANCGVLGASGLRWGPAVRVDDGQVDVCIFKGRSFLDYLSVCWNIVRGRHREEPNIGYLSARRVVAIHSERAIPVQGDGEVIGETPLEVHVEPGALRVVVPCRGAGDPLCLETKRSSP